MPNPNESHYAVSDKNGEKVDEFCFLFLVSLELGTYLYYNPSPIIDTVNRWDFDRGVVAKGDFPPNNIQNTTPFPSLPLPSPPFPCLSFPSLPF